MIGQMANLDGVSVAGVEDIMSMKLAAAASRGSKKDLIDIYWVSKTISLEQQIDWFREKYAGVDYSLIHIKKSLVYFLESEAEKMPKMLVDCSWDEVKSGLERVVMELR